jgi:hypothetical protein
MLRRARVKPIEHRAANRWRRVAWSVVVGLAALALPLVLVALFATYGPDPGIIVRPRTTVVTEPLAADGLPDYEAAWLAMSGPAPPPTDNAAVDLLRATWPMGVSAAELPKVCRALGIPADTPERQLEPIEGMNATGGKMVFEAMEREWPWKAEEQPALAEWLEANGDSLDSLVLAADKPRYWFPSPSLLDEQPGRLSDMLFPDVHRLRDVVRLLKSRAMLHLGEGRHHAAWRDLRAIRRWGSLLRDPGNGPGGGVVFLTSLAISGTAEYRIAVDLLGDPDLPPDLVESIREEYSATDVAFDLVEMMRGDWLSLRDSTVWIARRMPEARSARGALALQGWQANPVIAQILATRLDWNAILELLSEGQSDMDAALARPTYLVRHAATARLARSWRAAVPPPGGKTWSADEILLILDTRRRTNAMASSILDAGVPAVGYLKDLARWQASVELSRTAAALAAWRADRPTGANAYPERLDELVPRYVDKVPSDPFNDLPLRYERRGDGYLLMSIGSNGIDDGGDGRGGWIIDGEWQSEELLGIDGLSDIVIRVPVPRRSPAERGGDAPAAPANVVD